MNILQISRQVFSKLILPYNPKGFKNIDTNELLQIYVQENIGIEGLSGFTYAFTNLLDSIDDPEFSEFVKEICDPELAEAFTKGVQRMSDQQLSLTKIVNTNIEELAYPSAIQLLLDFNQEISFYQNKQAHIVEREMTKVIAFDNSQKKQSLHLLLDVYVRSSVGWSIDGQNPNPENFHLVRFLALKEEKPQGFFQNMKMLIRRQSQELLLGQNPTWKIVDIDNFMGDRVINQL